MNIDFQALWQMVITNLFVQALGILLGLVVVDLLLGVASALKRGVFSFQTMANFYQTNIIPKILGWIALSFLGYLVSASTLGAQVAAVVGPVTSGSGYAVVVLALLSSIASNAKEVFSGLPTIQLVPAKAQDAPEPPAK